MVNKKEIFPIGIGTYGIDLNNLDKEIDGLNYSINKGENYISISMMYENGEIVKNLRNFINKVDRDKLFINVNIEPIVEKVEDIEKQLDEYLEILNLEYIDNLQIHTPKAIKIPLLEAYIEMNRMVKMGKSRFLGISNCNLEQLKEIDSKVKLDFFEGVYNLECKINEDIGVIDYCKENDITFIVYQALRRNRTAKRNYPVLLELAKKYNKTQNQIILNWIINEKELKPIIKCTDIGRIDENIDSANFEMIKEDYEVLNNFRNKDFDNIKIDWNNSGDGVEIDQLANQFD